MANLLYKKYRQACISWSQAGLLAPIDLSADDIRVFAIDTTLYTPDPDNDQFLTDIPVGARVAMSNMITAVTTGDGIFDAANTTFIGITGPTVEAIVIAKWTGVDATSPLISFLDNVINLPLTPTGQNEIVVWPSTPAKIFKI